MKKLSLATTVAILLASLVGCSTQTYIVSEQSAQEKASFDKMQHFFVAGIGQQVEKETNEVCANGSTAKVQTQQTFLNGLLNMISYGIYSPRDMRIYCKK
ncbi:lipoprotein bor [Rodentibacter rarus]|uniref:Lipoprotein bor n=1 Tax=Rodentibacter rarus TaxID=1908260 RepID=A0A1V3IJ35_9PAST|nr:Bor family protein [Rodentibacter rarus]OOF41299.1 lipoprotein bor [Rodentibacter rarus]OOF41661.1 lipoprotein bor [Rodentibacter rarus]